MLAMQSMQSEKPEDAWVDRSGVVTPDEDEVKCPQCGHINEWPEIGFTVTCEHCGEYIEYDEEKHG